MGYSFCALDSGETIMVLDAFDMLIPLDIAFQAIHECQAESASVDPPSLPGGGIEDLAAISQVDQLEVSSIVSSNFWVDSALLYPSNQFR
jgi:hypothetical protein